MDTRVIFITQLEGYQGDIHSSGRGTPGRYLFPSYRDTREIFIPQVEGHQGEIYSPVRRTPGRYSLPS